MSERTIYRWYRWLGLSAITTPHKNPHRQHDGNNGNAEQGNVGLRLFPHYLFGNHPPDDSSDDGSFDGCTAPLLTLGFQFQFFLYANRLRSSIICGNDWSRNWRGGCYRGGVR